MITKILLLFQDINALSESINQIRNHAHPNQTHVYNQQDEQSASSLSANHGNTFPPPSSSLPIPPHILVRLDAPENENPYLLNGKSRSMHTTLQSENRIRQRLYNNSDQLLDRNERTKTNHVHNIML